MGILKWQSGRKCTKTPGPCITNVFATRRKNFSKWHRSFQRKLLSHWLKFLRHVAITLVIQGPVSWHHDLFYKAISKPPDARYTVEIKLLCLFHFSKSVPREHWRWLSRYNKFPTKCVIKLITTLIYRNDLMTTIVNIRWSMVLRMIEWHTTENYIVF